MPKELTHWIIAQKTLDSLQQGTGIHRIISSNRELFLLGSVLPDTPAYLSLGRKKQVLKKIDQDFHDPQSCSFRPALRALNFFGNRADDRMKSLLLGTLSHIITDAVFHPFVYHFSGNLNSLRHYRLETYIDLYFTSLTESPALKYKTLLPGTKSGIRDVARFMSAYFDSDMLAGRKAFIKAINHHAFFQSLWHNPRALKMIRRLGRLSRTGLDEVIELFYPENHPGPVLQQEYDYFHPVTGELLNTTIESLGETACTQASALFMKIGDRTDTDSLKEFLNSHTGMHPLTGITGKRYSEMKHFNTEIDLDRIIFS